LRLFETYHSVQQTRLAALKADIDQGFADIEAGRVSPVNMVDIKTEGRRLRKSS
ncbi:MAG: type II toxin-antitoxin system ParD family antitoxin, partial [Betaproteobacteria bacterium]|nr:type II toxin-antitoxin system ParD family antitoxin [Betaproteobacteria bacterium]